MSSQQRVSPSRRSCSLSLSPSLFAALTPSPSPHLPRPPSFPLDVIKTKIQSVPPSSLLLLSPQSPSPQAPSPPPPPPQALHPYRSIASTVAATWRDSGWRGFVAGLGPTLLRSVPVNMVRSLRPSLSLPLSCSLTELTTDSIPASPPRSGHVCRLRARRFDVPIEVFKRARGGGGLIINRISSKFTLITLWQP